MRLAAHGAPTTRRGRGRTPRAAALADIPELDIVRGRTFRPGDRAARMKRAAGRHVARVGRVTGQPGRVHAVRVVADDRERGRQRPRVRVRRVTEDLARSGPSSTIRPRT